MTTRSQIVDEARSWLGTPEHHQAHLKGVGCDCIGLILGVGLAFQMPEAIAFINDIRYRGYGRPPNPRLMIEACDTYLDRIQVNEALPGDIPMGRVEKEPQHFGILSSIDPIYMIHAYSQVGRVVENRIDENWRAKIVRMYRYRGIE